MSGGVQRHLRQSEIGAGQGSVVRGSLDTGAEGVVCRNPEEVRCDLENGHELAELACLESGLRNAVKWA